MEKVKEVMKREKTRKENSPEKPNQSSPTETESE